MKAAVGKVFKYGDNVDTDVIIPARYLNTSDPEELAAHCMEDIDQDFVHNVKQGDIMVARQNFGCGSSREHAPIAIQASGISCVIAETFARIFYRNAINIGLPIIECEQAAKEIGAGDEVEVDFDTGMIVDRTTGKSYQGQAFPDSSHGGIRERDRVSGRGGRDGSLRDGEEVRKERAVIPEAHFHGPGERSAPQDLSFCLLVRRNSYSQSASLEPGSPQGAGPSCAFLPRFRTPS